MKRQLVLNRIQTPDGTILTSYHRHDFVAYKDKNGKMYCLDGGNDYQKIVGADKGIKNLTIYSDAPFEVIRESYHRGSHGKNGDEDMTWTPICKMSDEWLRNVIEYNYNKGLSESFANEMYKKELDYRKENNISILDDNTTKSNNTDI